jgi:metal-responsive CopG/Arc/MetJ family transcriptional regulator
VGVLALTLRGIRRWIREGRSRSAVFRDAIEHYLASDAEAEIDQMIVEGYERIPP